MELWPDQVTRAVEARTEDLQRQAAGLRAEREAIDDRLTRIEGELQELEIAVRVYRRFSDRDAPAERIASADQDEGGERNGTIPDFTNLTLSKSAESALKYLGGTAPSRDIRQLLVKAGKLPPTRNSYGYLLKILRDKTDRFVKDDETGAWTLRE